MLLTSSGNQHHIDQRLVLLYPFGHHVFDRDVGKTIQNTPSRCTMHIIKQDDGCYLLCVLIVKILERSAELVRIRVFTIYHYYNLFAATNKLVDASFNVTSSIRNFTVLCKVVTVHLIKQRHEFFIVIEQIADILRFPVYIHLVRIKEQVSVINICCFFCPFLFQAIWHEKEVFYIQPIQPKRK